MRRPLVSVVIETINARFEASAGSLCENVTPTMQALQRQTLPQEKIEQILVLDAYVAASDAEEIHRRWPEVKLVSSLRSGYFFAKNAGVAAANAVYGG